VGDGLRVIWRSWMDCDLIRHISRSETLTQVLVRPLQAPMPREGVVDRATEITGVSLPATGAG
jgi:hypothetical protein